MGFVQPASVLHSGGLTPQVFFGLPRTCEFEDAALNFDTDVGCALPNADNARSALVCNSGIATKWLGDVDELCDKFSTETNAAQPSTVSLPPAQLPGS